MEETLNKFMAQLAKRHDENATLVKEIRASTETSLTNQGASIKAIEIQVVQIAKVLYERFPSTFTSSTETNPQDHVMSIITIIEPTSNSCFISTSNDSPSVSFMTL